MGISRKLDEGLIYRFVQTAIKMRSLQRQRGRVTYNEKQVHGVEMLFDGQLDLLLENIDQVDTERVITAKSNFSRRTK